MTVGLHGAVRTAVDEARREAEAATRGPWDYQATTLRMDGSGTYQIRPWPSGPQVLSAYLSGADAAFIAAWNPRRALAMCDWADDVLRRHEKATIGGASLTSYDECRCVNQWPCIEVLRVAAAFGVETGETP